jgi:hypothetical protein
MIANPPDEQARGWVKVWEERTPIGRYVGLTFWLCILLRMLNLPALPLHLNFITMILPHIALSNYINRPN